MKLSVPLFLPAFFLSLLLPVHAEQQPYSTTIKFSDPAKPGTLKLRLARGDVRITGADVTEVSVTTKSQPAASKPRKDGMRELGSSSSFALSEKENVVTLEAGSLSGPPTDFTVTVPRATLVSLTNSLSGNIRCADLTGDLEIKSLNGEVQLERISGAAFVETSNGEIRADLQTLQSGKTYSFTSVNGEVHVRVPNAAKANVKLRTQNGSILTDFDEQALQTKVEVNPRKTSARSAMSSGRKSASRNANDDEVNVEIRLAVQEAVQAGAEVAREAALVAREALRTAADELRAQSDLRRAAADDAHKQGDMRHGGDDLPFPPIPPLPPMTGGKIVSGTLNGGGPEIQIATVNGDVVLQKLPAKP